MFHELTMLHLLLELRPFDQCPAVANWAFVMFLFSLETLFDKDMYYMINKCVFSLSFCKKKN